MNRRTFLTVGSSAAVALLAGCSGSEDAAVDVTTFEDAQYEVDAQSGETIRVAVTDQEGGMMSVLINDPTGSVAVSTHIRDEGELTHEAEQSGTFSVSVQTNSRTSVRIFVE